MPAPTRAMTKKTKINIRRHLPFQYGVLLNPFNAVLLACTPPTPEAELLPDQHYGSSSSPLEWVGRWAHRQHHWKHNGHLIASSPTSGDRPARAGEGHGSADERGRPPSVAGRRTGPVATHAAEHDLRRYQPDRRFPAEFLTQPTRPRATVLPLPGRTH